MKGLFAGHPGRIALAAFAAAAAPRTLVAGKLGFVGALKATNGSFNYEIPASADLAPYRGVVVWCRAFSVLVTWSDLR